jgi:hypothetical protein
MVTVADQKILFLLKNEAARCRDPAKFSVNAHGAQIAYLLTNGCGCRWNPRLSGHSPEENHAKRRFQCNGMFPSAETCPTLGALCVAGEERGLFEKRNAASHRASTLRCFLYNRVFRQNWYSQDNQRNQTSLPQSLAGIQYLQIPYIQANEGRSVPKKKLIPRNRAGSVVETANRPSLLFLNGRDAVQRPVTDREHASERVAEVALASVPPNSSEHGSAR